MKKKPFDFEKYVKSHVQKQKNKSVFEKGGKEVKDNPSKILAHTRAKFGEADAKRQKIAIIMSKRGKGKRKNK